MRRRMVWPYTRQTVTILLPSITTIAAQCRKSDNTQAATKVLQSVCMKHSLHYSEYIHLTSNRYALEDIHLLIIDIEIVSSTTLKFY